MKKIVKQSGYTLIEIMIVLGIVSSIAIGAFVLVGKVNTSRTVNSELDNTRALTASINSSFSGAATYTGLNPANAIILRAVPDNMVSGVNVVNAFGNLSIENAGSAALAPAAATGIILTGVPKAFGVSFPTVPSESCIKFVTGLAATYPMVRVLNNAGVLQYTYHNNTLGLNLVPSAAAPFVETTVSPVNVATACGAAGNRVVVAYSI